MNFCYAFEIPVLTLTNVSGFEATVDAEKKMAKAAAKLTYAFANATVPKVNVITGHAFGNAVNVMNSKALGCDMTYAWEDASMGMMDAKPSIIFIATILVITMSDYLAMLEEVFLIII